MKMKAKLGTGGWGFRQQTLDEQLRTTRDLGLTTIEASIAESPRASVPLTARHSDVAALRAKYREYGLPLTHVFTGNDFTLASSRDNRAGVARMAKIIRLTAALGARYLRIFAGFTPVAEVTGERWEVMIDCLHQSAAHARKAGVVLAIETHGGVRNAANGVIHCHSVSTEPSALLRLCREMPADIVLNFDPANLRAAGVMWPHEIVPFIASRIRYLHLKDFAMVDPAQNIVRPVGCGEGLLDWEPLMRSLAFYRHTALIEYEPTEDVVDGTSRSLKFMRRYV